MRFGTQRAESGVGGWEGSDGWERRDGTAESRAGCVKAEGRCRSRR
jgi:hypothetical protein